LYRERNVVFRPQKTPGTFRIFCLGGSASAGWPHPADEIYTAYLQKALTKAYPGRRIEVINVSAHAYAAYRVRHILAEVLEFQPDLFIIYSGNNEFLEPRVYSNHATWLDAVESLANYSTVYRILRGSFVGIWLFPENTFRDGTREHQAYQDWSRIEEVPLALRVDPLQFRKVKEHYEFSISSMVRAAQAKGVPVILVTVPTNLRAWEPNVSTSVPGEHEKEWRAHYEAGRAQLLRGNAPAAIESLTKSVKLAPGNADSHYYLGKAYEAVQDLERSYASFDRAKELDANPFRAISAFNETIRRVGAVSPNVSVLDAENLFRRRSYPYAPGFNLFLDYVHPTKQGNLILAAGVFETIRSGGYIGQPSSTAFDPTRAGTATYEDAKDQNLQRALIVLAIMMHQNETVVRIADLIDACPGGIGALESKHARRVASAREIFRELVDWEHRKLLRGKAPAAEGARIQARLNRLYRDIWGQKMFDQKFDQTFEQ
jgi:tetratricopeptide (TPR) repeat protein